MWEEGQTFKEKERKRGKIVKLRMPSFRKQNHKGPQVKGAAK